MSTQTKTRFNPDDCQKRQVLHDAVFYEILFTFGVSPHDETDYCAWEHVNYSRMGHARVLYAFFETSIVQREKIRKRNKDYDDVVAEDFGFCARKIPRPEGERLRLNKDLFHLTYSRLRHTPSTKAWPDSILANLHGTCVEFIRHLLSNGLGLGTPTDFIKWKQLLVALTSGRELRIGRPSTESGLEPNWVLRLGRPLHSGGELTRIIPKPKSN